MVEEVWVDVLVIVLRGQLMNGEGRLFTEVLKESLNIIKNVLLLSQIQIEKNSNVPSYLF